MSFNRQHKYQLWSQGREKSKKSIYTTPFGKWLIISSPLPWPKGKIKIPHKEFFETKPNKELNEDKKKLIELIQRMENINSTNFTESPGFGELTKAQWARLHCRHINHHLEQFGR